MNVEVCFSVEVNIVLCMKSCLVFLNAPIIETIITKRSSTAFVRTIFAVVVVCASATLYSLIIVMALLGFTFMLAL